MVRPAHLDHLITHKKNSLRRPAAFQCGGNFSSSAKSAFRLPFAHKSAEFFGGIFTRSGGLRWSSLRRFGLRRVRLQSAYMSAGGKNDSGCEQRSKGWGAHGSSERDA